MAGLDDMMHNMNIGEGRGGGRGISRGGGGRSRGGRVMGGWADRGRGGLGRGGGGWKRGGGGNNVEIDESDLRHKLNQNNGDLRAKLNNSREDNSRRENQTYMPRSEREMYTHQQDKNRPKKNTECFTPSHEPAQMRIISVPSGLSRYDREIQTRDVLLVNDLFCKAADLYLYNKLHHELSESGLTEHQIWASWHGDSHLIANDRSDWKKYCPTFHMVLDKIADYFNMDIKATRLNWYRDSTEWKPFHHDAAAIKEDKAAQSNLTVAVSFGLEREAAFEHAKDRTVISCPQPNGSAYVFARDINVIWRHGILQMPPEKKVKEGRISVIAWGWTQQRDV